MAEERNVGLARATDSTADPDTTKAELQRRMEEARESITQTVTEIKDTVVTQYQQVRENISDTLDWREQYKRHTLPFTLTAFAVGTFVGYTVMGAFKGEREDDFEDDGAFDRVEAGFDRGLKDSQRSYAAQPVLGGAGAGAYQRSSSRPESNAATEAADVFGQSGGGSDRGEDVGPETRPSYSSGYQAPSAPRAQGLASYASSASSASAEEEEPKGPGVFERFKETKAYDKLQGELSTLGERAIEELSRTAQTVVVPALLSKLKDMIGIDLSTQREVAKRSRVEHETAQSTAKTAAAVDSHDSGQGGTSARAAAGGTEGYGAS
jgi:hypothetical protein